MFQYDFVEYSIKEYIEFYRLGIKITKQMIIDFQVILEDLEGKKKWSGLYLSHYEEELKNIELSGKINNVFSKIDDGTPFEERKKYMDSSRNFGYFGAQNGPFKDRLAEYVDVTFEKELLKTRKKYNINTTDTELTGSIGSKKFIPHAKEKIDSINNFQKLTTFKNKYSVTSPLFDKDFRIYRSYKNLTNSSIKRKLNLAFDQINEISNYINEVEFNKFNVYPSLALSKLPENSVKSDIKQKIESRDVYRNESDSLLYPEVIQYYTILETDKILLERGMKDYSMYQVTRSNHNGIDVGSYFYSFDEYDNLLMTTFPFQQADLKQGTYIVFDSELYRSGEVIVIPKEEILSYKLYGTEMMQSSVTTNSKSEVMDARTSNDLVTYKSPSIVGTFFSSMLFGSAYTILNGVGKQMYQQTNVLGNKLDGLSDQLNRVVDAINNISITTNHKIIDTSRVQIILTNKRDLEIDGISIFYDLNRIFPGLDNQKESPPKQIEQTYKSSSPSLAEEVLALKQLLDQGIIDDEEFKAMKKKLLK